MRKIRVFCTTCLALQGLLLPGAEAFALPAFRTSSIGRTHPSRGRGGYSSRHHEHSLNDNSPQRAGTAMHQAYSARPMLPLARGAVAVGPLGEPRRVDISERACEPSASVGTDSAAVGDTPPLSAFRAFVTSIAAVSIFVAVSTSSFWSSSPRAARADSTTSSALELQVPNQRSSQEISTLWLAAAKRRKESPPPPEIPPGRITLAQWFSRSMSKIRVKLSASAPESSTKVALVGKAGVPGLADMKRKLARSAEGIEAGTKGFSGGGGQEAGGVGVGGTAAPSVVSQVHALFVRRQSVVVRVTHVYGLVS